MGEVDERRRFEAAYSPETVEVVVLTGTYCGGAGKAGDEMLWTAGCEVISHVDEHGRLVEAPSRLAWLARDQDSDGWVHDLQPTTQYRLRIRRGLPSPPSSPSAGADASAGEPASADAAPASADAALVPRPAPEQLMLVELLERDLSVPALDERRARYLAPRTLQDPLGRFELDREAGVFSGEVTWLGTPVTALLHADEPAAEGAETAVRGLATLRGLVADADSVDRRWRDYLARMLTDLANDWRADDEATPDDAPELTEDDVARRVRLAELAVTADGSTTPTFDDGDLFWGHAIVIDIEPDGTMTDAYLAG